MIKLEKINKFYDATSHALKDIDLVFEKKSINFIVGKSGSGKSTLLNIIGCLDSFDSGSYTFFEDNVSSYSSEELNSLRNHCFGFVFQDFLLFDNMTVYENIEFSLDIQNDASKDRILEVMEEVGILDLKDRKINQISGGERQRVAIARALVKKPSVILADEPTGNLDHESKIKIFDLFKKISKDYLVIIVSHDFDAARKYADRIIKLDNGKIIDDFINNETKYDLLINNEIILNNIDELELFNYIESSPSESLTINKRISPLPEQEGLDAINFAKKDKLSLKFLFKNVNRLLHENKVILFLNISFLLLIFFVIIILTSLTKFDYNVSANNFLSEYNDNNLNLYMRVENVHILSSLKSKNIYHSKLLKEELNNHYDNVFDVKAFQIQTDSFSMQSNCLFVDSNYKDIADDEVIITDYLSSKLNISFGDCIKINTLIYNVIDIIETDYISYAVDSKLRDEKYIDYANHRLKTEYNIIYLNESNKEILANSYNGISLQSSNFIIGNKNNSFFDSFLVYSSIGDSSLLYGSLPIEENDVVISKSLFNSYFEGEEPEQVLGRKFNFKDLSKEEYCNFYSDRINLYEYFPSGVNIVGVIDSPIADVYLNDDVYNEISSEYFNYYYSDYYLCLNVDKIYPASSFEILIDEPNIKRIYSISDMLSSLNGAVVGLLIVIALIGFILIVNYSFTLIKKSQKNIGIMKALGVRNIEINKLLLIKLSILILITLIASNALYFSTIGISNYLTKQVFSEKPFDILYYDFGCLMIVDFIIILTFVISTALPIIRLEKFKPILIIRKED